MRLYEITTNVQKKIRFVREENVTPDDRGWKVDKITAFIDEDEVGYLKISYIPKENFNKIYHSIFNFISTIENRYLLPFEKRDVPYDHLTDRELVNCLSRCRIDASGKDRKSLLLLMKKAEKELLSLETGHRFKRFAEFHVDKPLVDYIHVEKEMRRKGIGFLLYKEGAAWMAERGLKLHASDLQSAEAKMIWQRMGDEGKVREHKNRRYIDYSTFSDVDK